MNSQLTAKQVRELADFHKKPISKLMAPRAIRICFLHPDEEDKNNPGIVTHYKIKRKPPPSEQDCD